MFLIVTMTMKLGNMKNHVTFFIVLKFYWGNIWCRRWMV